MAHGSCCAAVRVASAHDLYVTLAFTLWCFRALKRWLEKAVVASSIGEVLDGPR
jgi:hypothetical protein